MIGSILYSITACMQNIVIILCDNFVPSTDVEGKWKSKLKRRVEIYSQNWIQGNNIIYTTYTLPIKGVTNIPSSTD
jgi:hypothetical protein